MGLSVFAPEFGVLMPLIPAPVRSLPTESAYSLLSVRPMKNNHVGFGIPMPMGTRSTFSHDSNGIVPLPCVWSQSLGITKIGKFDRTQPRREHSDDAKGIRAGDTPATKGAPTRVLEPWAHVAKWENVLNSPQTPRITHRNLEIDGSTTGAVNAPFSVNQTCHPSEIDCFHGMSISQFGCDIQGNTATCLALSPTRG